MPDKSPCASDEDVKEMQHENHYSHTNKDQAFNQDVRNRVHPKIDHNRTKMKSIGDKTFTFQDSVLTTLYRIPHVNTMYNMFLAAFILMTGTTALHSYVTKGIINFGQVTINRGMRGFWRGAGMWTIMQAAVVLAYLGLKFWGSVRLALSKNPTFRQVWDSICLWAFALFQISFMVAVINGVIQMDLACISAGSILIEMIRMIMKMYAFIRTNAVRILNGELKIDSSTKSSKEHRYPSLGQFTYYMFAPTFIYRDNYPRTSKINLNFALCRLLEVVGVTFFLANIHERFIEPNFQNFGKERITPGDLILKIFSMDLPALLICLGVFYCILHSWLNFTAELLRFPDRIYYKDWWTSHNYSGYYRNWNLVVHEWLYEYIYKDALHYVFPGSKVAANFTVFVVSAVMHELICSVAFGFFFPVMFVLFAGFGVFFMFISKSMNRTVGNIFLWCTLAFGNGLMVSLYAMEIFARINCVADKDSSFSFWVPVVFSCNGLS
ncbi:unnamed protein product [Hermetia illucens]|uniref:O-acyltransferase n=1 Tax=Hermetia illucens TaxID=343691 RepID=A0A7R8YX21_HERIL|nr:sterol O-acyltransferase 1-like [Hermetia illucens]XP_037918102.1 sterol O-acyltransferase 1-like [Hermetia illucens]XP_037918103.1 sterol O-acyltransferase 1-like [Hermetia illucens]XP_037918104.1 sterol O-acyltransferase 1-like [Hermetia illucens]XP_037918105.1 sterol O-acyltransferase 1-like [Hermetia illucens]XP_037918106.1 sterol O-acyltransferase 1-like [Hermetia illucens]XP_037918108.1 sterol O-acyltransferase 1-like [Hermetia illucens]CAD7089003.1 unnamed protein product [Hermetia